MSRKDKEPFPDESTHPSPIENPKSPITNLCRPPTPDHLSRPLVSEYKTLLYSVPERRGSVLTSCVRVQNPFVLGPGASRLDPDVLCQSTKHFCTRSRSVAARSRRLVSEYKTLLYSAPERRGSIPTSCVRVQNPFVLRQESLLSSPTETPKHRNTEPQATETPIPDPRSPKHRAAGTTDLSAEALAKEDPRSPIPDPRFPIPFYNLSIPYVLLLTSPDESGKARHLHWLRSLRCTRSSGIGNNG